MKIGIFYALSILPQRAYIDRKNGNSYGVAMVELGHSKLTFEQLLKIAKNREKVSLHPVARNKIQESRSWLESRLELDSPIYGVNTGFGAFSQVRIDPEDLKKLQVHLLRSHAVGVGPALCREEARSIMLLRAVSLATGYSGVRPMVVEKILEFLNHDLIPWIPSQGSVGASGDLAPLAHMALSLIGEGFLVGDHGEKIPTSHKILERGITPLQLEPKEGLSLINGCQVSTGIGLWNLSLAINALKAADIVGAMTLEALRGSRKAFDPLVSMVRPHPGEIHTASNLRRLLGETSPIGESHKSCDRVQDAYSLRCMPTVHGATKTAIKQVQETLLIEANSATDNPLVFPEHNQVISCGNFHGMPVAAALDYACIAMSYLGSISEQRLAKLLNPATSFGLPAFLTPNGGLNSGHMIIHVTAASLVSENKVLCHPASVDSIPTSADKEDHVSMATLAARKFSIVTDHVIQILACELLSAAQALDLLRPLTSSPAIEKVHQTMRELGVPFASEDRYFEEDLQKLKEFISSGKMVKIVEDLIGPLQW